MNRKLILISMLAPLAAPASALAGPDTLSVGRCAGATYATIQSAVDAAAPGSTIKICPGTYAEQVAVPPGKGTLVLQGEGNDPPVIQYPAVGENADGVDGADAVISLSTDPGDSYEVNNMVVQGPWTDASNGRHIGVLVIGGGQAQLHGDTVRNIVDSDPTQAANFDGFAVSIGDSNLFDDGIDVPGNATVTDSTLVNYQMLGLTASVPGTSAVVEHNTVSGPRTGSAANSLVGVVVGDGATAQIRNNTITNNFTPAADPANDATQGTGIYLGFAPSAVALRNNVVSHNDIGLEIVGASDVLDTNDKLLDNNYEGVRIDPASPFGDLSRDNTLTGVHASGNLVYDCEDDTTGLASAGTANHWLGDHGQTMNRPGLCRGPKSGAADRAARAHRAGKSAPKLTLRKLRHKPAPRKAAARRARWLRR